MSPSSKDVESPDRPGPTIFVTDPSAEADRLSTALRSRGYEVIDVPPSLLVARVAVQLPAVIVLDIDAEGAMALAAALREVPGASAIDILFLGQAGRTIAGAADGLQHEGSGFLERPVDADALVRKVDALVRARPSLPVARSSASTPSRRPSATSLDRPVGDAPRSSRVQGSDPWASRDDAGDDPLERPFGSDAPAAPRPPLPELSQEIAGVLRRAEERALQDYGPGSSQAQPTSQPPSPDEEVDAVLPAEVLAALDDPLDESDEELASESGLSTGVPRLPSTSTPEVTTATAHLLANGGQPPEGGGASVTAPPGRPIDTAPPARIVDTAPPGRATDTSLMPPAGALSDPKELETPRPPRRNARSGAPSVHVPAAPPSPRDAEPAPSLPPASRSRPPTGRASATARPAPASGRPARRSPPPPRASPSSAAASPVQPSSGARAPTSEEVRSPRDRPEADTQRPDDADAATFALPPVLTPGDALSAFAVCVRERATGALCIEAPEGIRRILLREGDVVTAASGLDDESLVAFLGSRGDLPPLAVAHLQGKIPAYGRHAGAALVANGHISQDQLWPVLRAHAEWILRCTVAVESGSATFESSPPGRLKAEPSVFGGSTGAEVLIEVVRRAVPPAAALGHIGSEVRVGRGARWELLSECALPEWELAWLDRTLGMHVEEAVSLATAEVLPVLYALAELGVLALEAAALERGQQRRSPHAAPAFDAIDAQAVRTQVKARLALVQDADYFALLGVPRAATSYEIHRAYAELRRSLEPSRVLTAATADLADDIALILEVIDEAHEILRDHVRRERYRRAIEEQPPS